MNYYNEIDPQCAQWLRNLISVGLIPPGDVDERSIEDVIPNELRGYTQHHFFAGIGGWPLALDLAGWPRSMPVVTGSCPCQSFSVAGKGAGFADKRHLWPAWFHIIRELRPNVIFGEQVSAAIRFGWLDLVQTDLEGAGYAVEAAVLGAHSVGAPHIRQRLYWVAESDTAIRRANVARRNQRNGAEARRQQGHGDASERGSANCLGDSERNGRRLGGRATTNVNNKPGDVALCALVQPDSAGSLARHSATETAGHGRPAQSASFWDGAEWIKCRDGKSRAVEPGVAPLAHGIPARVVRLRAYGNSIVPQTAAAFIKAYMSAEQRQAAAA